METPAVNGKLRTETPCVRGNRTAEKGSSARKAETRQCRTVADRHQLADGLMRAEGRRAGHAKRGTEVVEHSAGDLRADQARGQHGALGAGLAEPDDGVGDAFRVAEG